ncbi:MAG TPA: diphthine--ammonia ligase [Ohtaekwangia sp.]
MDSKKKVTISWSGGKDSAFALYKILLSGEYTVVSLHTVINRETGRVGLHGVREDLIDYQANSLGIPLHKIYVQRSEDHHAYEQAMRSFYQQCVRDQTSGIVFGDIFLEDLRAYREKLLSDFPIQSFYPLWKIDTAVLIHDFIHAGFKTVVCSAHTRFFSKEQLGKVIDQDFVLQLPEEVDPCGERGEFHTWVYDGPLFKKPLLFSRGEVIEKSYHYKKVNAKGQEEELNESFYFQELLPRFT